MCACTYMHIRTGLFNGSDLHFWRLFEASYQKETHCKQEVKKAFQTHIQQIGQYRIHRFGSKAEIDHLTKFGYFIVCHKKEGHMSTDNLNINSTGYLVI